MHENNKYVVITCIWKCILLEYKGSFLLMIYYGDFIRAAQVYPVRLRGNQNNKTLVKERRSVVETFR